MFLFLFVGVGEGTPVPGGLSPLEATAWEVAAAQIPFSSTQFHSLLLYFTGLARN